MEILGDIERGAEALRNGHLVIFPTETVYGLGARAFDERAVAKVFAAKGRPATHPLIVHVEGAEAARKLISRWSERAELLSKAFWPGPLTLVLPRPEAISRGITGGGETVAIRAPNHPIATALLVALGEPIVAPSANRYQSLSPTSVAHLEPDLVTEAALVLDGGPCLRGVESTVVDLTTAAPTVLRPGSISLEMLRTVLADVADGTQRIHEKGDVHRAPGMDARHYAPKTKLAVVDRNELSMFVAQAIHDADRPKMAFVYHSPFEQRPSPHLASRLFRMDADPELYARSLFDVLHRADKIGVDLIVVERPPTGDRWAAIHDRLARASASNH